MYSDSAILLDRVSKRYRLGNSINSIRDVFGALSTHTWLGSRRIPDARYIEAVKDISFKIHKGETVGIIGHNGAGKTTTLRLLSGITRPTAGRIFTQGRISALIELGAGFHPDLTGRENVYLNGAILGLKRKEIDRLYETIVAFAELEQFMDTPVKRYSSGMYVRLGFAIAVHTHPDILLVDEVLSVGDLSFQAKCMNKIGELQKRGVSILLVTHNMVLVRRYCSRTILMENGNIIFDGDTNQAILEFQERLFRSDNNLIKGQISKGKNLFYKILLDDVRIVNLSGQYTTEVSSMDPFEVQIQYHSISVVEDPIFEIVFHSTTLGGIVARIDNRMQGFHFDTLYPGKGEISIKVAGLPLKGDRIEISAAIFDSHYQELLDWRERMRSFNIKPISIGEGILEIKTAWSVINSNSSKSSIDN